MIISYVGSGGKTTLLKRTAREYLALGQKVFVTTTTHMFVEEDMLLTDDPERILQVLHETGYAMAGIPVGKGRIGPLSSETYHKVCAHADVVLVEADGSRHLPIKFPNAAEPMIPDNSDEVVVVCGLNAIGQKAQDVCHRLELVMDCLGIAKDTCITPAHIQKLVTEGYLEPLRQQYPGRKISVSARHDGSLYQRTIAAMLNREEDVTDICEEWFRPQPRLVLCGGGHVSREIAQLASRLDFPVSVIDERPDAVTVERFPTTDRIICDQYENLENYLDPGGYYVVVTPEHSADLTCVETILKSEFGYLGMIGSRKKVATIFAKLRADGFSDVQIDRIFAPIGLSIGAETPAEIGISILAQIIQEKNKFYGSAAPRELLDYKGTGVLCVVLEKHGSAPRGVGTMMFVGADTVLGTIGGGEPEYQVIRQARQTSNVMRKDYILNNLSADGLDMICGGTIRVLFIPI